MPRKNIATTFGKIYLAAVVYGAFLIHPLAAAPTPAQLLGDNDYSLSRVIDTVMQNSLQLISATEESNAAKANIKEAQSAYYPQFGVSAEYQHFTFVPLITLGNLSMPFGTANGFDGHASLQLKIYDFGKTSSAVASNRVKSDIAEENTNLTRQRLAFDAIKIFYSILLLRKSLEVQDAELADLEQNRKLMKSRVRAGAATRYDVLNADVRIALSKSRRIDLANALATQKIQLNRLLGRDEKVSVNVVGELIFTNPSHDETTLLREGSQKRIELTIALRQRDLAQEELSGARSGLLPDLYAGGNAGYKNGYPLEFNKLFPNAAFGVKVEAPIFSGFRDMAKIEERTAKLKAANASLEDVRISVRADILQAVKDLRSGEEKIAAADAQVEQARDASQRSRSLYNAGSITSREMLDARTALLQVELMRLESLYYSILAGFNLKRAVGEKLWSD